jgi:fructokinase
VYWIELKRLKSPKGKKMILCCGEALIDMVPVVGANGESTYAPLSGGAIFNTSIALGRLEIPAKILSGVSNDLFGEQLVDELHTSNVGTDLLIRSKRPTTLAFVKLTDGHAQYTFYDENSAGRMIDTSELPAVGSDVDALYFGGISLCADPAATTYENLAIREGGQKVVMIDPNIRISFIEDEGAYRDRLDRMMAVADIVKTSDEDLDWIIPGLMPLEAKVEALYDKGAKIVILTKGSQGAEAHVQGQDVVFVSAPKVTVADTVGAGDTFNAGFLAQLHNLGLLNKSALGDIDGESLAQALGYAAKVAAITVSRSGANPPYLSEL